MKALEVKQQIALKNILFATDFEASASRALPFAVALADRLRSETLRCARHTTGGLRPRSSRIHRANF